MKSTEKLIKERIKALEKENKQLKEITKKIKKEIDNLNKCDINEHNLYIFLLKIDEILKGE